MIWIRRLCVILIMVCVLLGIHLAAINYSVQKQEPVSLVDRKTIIFRIDSSFSSEEQDVIGKAMRRWEEATNRYVILKYYTEQIPLDEVFRWKSDGIPTIYNARSALSWPWHVGRYITSGAIGVAAIYTGDIFIFFNDGVLDRIVTHEIGHILLRSAWHSKNPKSIMYPIMSDNSALYIMMEEVNIIVSNMTS